mmetsp:Transcript_68284/g.211601  ORF Transcript_68284/g.211601 Transcript_68284/m.211601 type:complete len:116 (-) Transcript_68284:36-383(-)
MTRSEHRTACADGHETLELVREEPGDMPCKSASSNAGGSSMPLAGACESRLPRTRGALAPPLLSGAPDAATEAGALRGFGGCTLQGTNESMWLPWRLGLAECPRAARGPGCACEL